MFIFVILIIFVVLKENILQLIEKVNHIHAYDFNDVALEMFYFQYKNVTTYREFCDYLGIQVHHVTSVEQIPFLPIEFFKSRKIVMEGRGYSHVFQSSTTTGNTPSSHYIVDIELYKLNIKRTFEQHFGDISQYHFVALLPGYLERKNASLVFMVNQLMELSGMQEKPFFLHDYENLVKYLYEYKGSKQVILWGVTHALLQLAAYSIDLNDLIIIETGGMKGLGKELTREELYEQLYTQLRPKAICSEYGMTELLSHAYSSDGQNYNPSATLAIFLRDIYSPLQLVAGCRGAINVIDLCNVYSCSFIATQDIGTKNQDNTFSVLGRLDNSEIRGCNLMSL